MTSRGQSSQKTSKGRQKIEIKRRESIDDRRVTFTKRRTGLFEKGAELCVLCGAKVVIITFSEGRKAFCFGHPDVDPILEEYANWGGCGNPNGGAADDGRSLAYAHARSESERRYHEVTRQLDGEKARLKSTREKQGTGGGVGLFWWEERMDELELEELEFFHNSLEKLINNVAVKLGEITEQKSMLQQSLVGIGHDNVAAKDGWLIDDSPHIWSDPFL